MKVVSFRMDESEIGDLLRDTKQSESSNALRQVIQEWKYLKLGNSEKEKTLTNLQDETKELRSKLEDKTVELARTKNDSADLIRSLTIERNKLDGLLGNAKGETQSLRYELSEHIGMERKARWSENEMRGYAVMFFFMFFIGAALSLVLLIYLIVYHFDYHILLFAIFLSLFLMVVIGYFAKNYF